MTEGADTLVDDRIKPTSSVLTNRDNRILIYNRRRPNILRLSLLSSRLTEDGVQQGSEGWNRDTGDDSDVNFNEEVTPTTPDRRVYDKWDVLDGRRHRMKGKDTVDL